MSSLSLLATPFPMPGNEDDRLREVLAYSYADGGPQEVLDQLCRLARSLFDVPIALITLVGRYDQTFLAKCGVDADGTPRKDAFCTWTILDDEVFVVRDAEADLRFKGNPLVTGDMGIRFYAGAPLILRPGVRLGAFCLIDTAPRDFSEADAERLRMLATVAVNELDRRRTLIDLRRHESLLSQSARIAGIGSWLIDATSREITWSDETRRILDADPAIAPSHDFVLSLVSEEARDDLRRSREALLDHGVALDREFQIRTPRGRLKWVRCVGEAETRDGGVTKAVGTLQDLTLMRANAAEVERLAFSDGLTGLANRARFQERLSAAIGGAGRRGGRVGLILIGVDHMKDINGALGHEAGDALLRSVADRLLRTCDTADLVARLGGDEFAVIVPEIRGGAELTRSADLLMELLRHPVRHGGASLRMTVSAGVAIGEPGEADAARLLTCADIALHRAKDDGRDRLVVFTQDMRDGVERRSALLREVKDGIPAGEFTLHYQPLVTLRQPRRVAGFEALMRWRHPSDGLVSPDRFAAALDDHQCSLMLGEVALAEAIAQMRAWLDEGVEFGRVAVNVASSQFRAGNLADVVEARLRDGGVPADRLTLEVTENVYLGWGADVVRKTLQSLHDLGVQIALDDFGTGYASLSHLKALPIDRLKIDKSFVSSGQDDDILRAVATLGASLGMQVVAEGVEHAAQLETLSRMGCHLGQGYHFARPMPAAEVAAFLRAFSAGVPQPAKPAA